jgi:oligopeptide/dipeptide ABC transporter ATP-binding protein
MTRPTSDSAIMSLRGVQTHFRERGAVLDRLAGRDAGVTRAVDGLDLDVRRGEVLGLVGESGSGKTTLGRTMVGLAEPTAGTIEYDGEDVSRMTSRRLRRLRRRVQMIFQDPYSSLSPRRRVASLVLEPYAIHSIPPAERYTLAELLEMVELAFDVAERYPHELSGGQARRVGVARALALRPDFIVADEITAGLDVSVGASVLNLMQSLQADLGLSYLMITHNLNLVGYVADRVAVMYLGRLVEVGTTDQIFDAPLHPYTQALLSSISEPDPRRRRGEHRPLISGEVPSPKHPPAGCRFHPRCEFARERCDEVVPELEKAEDEHLVACHHWRRVREERSSLTA